MTVKKGSGRCTKADHGAQVIDKPCPKCGFQWGGGRESGDGTSAVPTESRRNNAPEAAANSADLCKHGEYAACERPALNERIRELETENERFRRSLIDAVDREEKAEARVKELETERDERPPRKGVECGD